MESAWKAAGATLVRRDSTDVADLVVVDLSALDATVVIQRLRAARPALPILAFGPHVDGDAFKVARVSGANEVVARGAVVERVLRRLAPAT